MSRDKFLTYHKVGIKFDSSICWRTHNRFLNDLNFYKDNFNKFDTVSEYGKNSLVISFDDGFESIYRYRKFFIENDIKTTIFIPTAYIDKADTWEVSLSGTRFRHLSREQLKNLSDDGHEIASHGHTHKALISLNEKGLTSELKASKDICENITNNECVSISVPFGLLNEKVIEACINSGYKNIITIGNISKKIIDNYSNKINIYRTFAVYLMDTNFSLRSKLNLNNYFYLEKKKLDIINWFSKGTVITKKLLDLL